MGRLSLLSASASASPVTTLGSAATRGTTTIIYERHRHFDYDYNQNNTSSGFIVLWVLLSLVGFVVLLFACWPSSWRWEDEETQKERRLRRELELEREREHFYKQRAAEAAQGGPAIGQPAYGPPAYAHPYHH
jgi:hypothetical protein